MMDERSVFDRFHEALELEPRAGAFERFRTAFVNPPTAAKKRRPVFRLRFSRMSLRIAAAVAVVAIAIALVAGLLATHNKPTSSVPATQDKQVKAYQTMMSTDEAAFGASLSNHCADINDTGCATAIGRIVPSLQKWVADIDAIKTPRQFAVINAQLRQHATATLSELNVAVAALRAKDNHGLANALNAGASQANWLHRATSAITEWQQVIASAYIALVNSDGQSLNLCAGCQAIAASDYAACTGTRVDVCISDLIPADDTIGQLQADVLMSAAPADLAGKDQRLQADLAAADSSLIRMLDALLARDVSTFNAARAAYRQAMGSISTDIKAITG